MIFLLYFESKLYYILLYFHHVYFLCLYIFNGLLNINQIVVDDDRQLRALLHARKRSKRDEPALSADDVTSLGDRFVKGSDVS